jgi:hypothetical protein
MKQNESLNEPFFARFLETQKVVESQEQNDPWPLPVPTKPLGDAYTDKWPSDWDEAV